MRANRLLEKIGRDNVSRFTRQEFLALDLVHREQPIPDNLRGSVNHLIDQGVMVPAGRGKYMLSRSLIGS